MESNLQSSPREDDRSTKASFRKPSSDVVNRKYRRRSLPAAAAGSSSPDGWLCGFHLRTVYAILGRKLSECLAASSPKHDGSSVQKRKDGSTELDKDDGRSQYGKSGDSHKHTDRQSSRDTHGYRLELCWDWFYVYRSKEEASLGKQKDYCCSGGAIMFGDSSLPSECSFIVEELKQTALCLFPGMQCAHGRPTTALIVNLEALHEKIAKLQAKLDDYSWHGLRQHKQS
ncbi:hypothetical protein ACFE04_010637 [Oxalis oulophora]